MHSTDFYPSPTSVCVPVQATAFFHPHFHCEPVLVLHMSCIAFTITPGCEEYVCESNVYVLRREHQCTCLREAACPLWVATIKV